MSRDHARTIGFALDSVVRAAALVYLIQGAFIIAGWIRSGRYDLDLGMAFLLAGVLGGIYAVIFRPPPPSKAMREER